MWTSCSFVTFASLFFPGSAQHVRHARKVRRDEYPGVLGRVEDRVRMACYFRSWHPMGITGLLCVSGTTFQPWTKSPERDTYSASGKKRSRIRNAPCVWRAPSGMSAFTTMLYLVPIQSIMFSNALGLVFPTQPFTKPKGTFKVSSSYFIMFAFGSDDHSVVLTDQQ